MAITFVGSTRNNNRDSGDTTTPIVSAPVGLQEGDFVLLTSSADNSGNSITLPSGTTQLYNGDVDNSSVGATKLAIGWQIIGATVPTDFTFTHGLLDGYAVSCVAFRNVDPTNPIDTAIDSAWLDGGNPIPATPVISTLTPNAVVLSLVAISRGPLFGDMDWNNFFYPPTGVTERVDSVDSAGTGFSGHAVGSELQSATGNTTPRTWTCIDNNDGGIAFTIALRPVSNAASFDPGEANIEVTATGTLTLAAAHFTGALVIETSAFGTMGQPEPIGHIETVTGVSNGTGTITLDYPISMMSGDYMVATLTSDNGALPLDLPSSLVDIDPLKGPIMEDAIRKAAGIDGGTIDPAAYSAAVYGGGRSGVTYLAQPQLNGVQILWQDAAGTVPAILDNDPIKRLDDVSGNGLHAIQSTGDATLFLRFDGTKYWIDFTNGYDRPTIPAAAFTLNRSTVVVGIDEDVISNTVLLSTENSNAFWFVSDPGSSSTIIEVDTDYFGIRTDTVNGMEEYTPFPTTRGDNAAIYNSSLVITFRQVEFNTLWKDDVAGAKLLGYGYSTGWQPSGKFFGLAIVDEDGFSRGVDRGDGTMAFASAVGYRMLDGTEGSSITFNHDSGESAVATISLFRYVNGNSGPMDVTPVIYEEGGLDAATTDDARAIPGLTTETNGAVVIGIITNEQATTGHTPPAGVTEIADLSTGTGNDGASVAIGFETLDEAGVYPSKNWTISTSTETPYRSFAIALKPLYPTIDEWPGNAIIESEATGSIVVTHRLAGAVEGVTTTTGRLGVGTQFEGSASAETLATASLGRKVHFSSPDPVIEVTSQGNLSLGISLEGTALAEALATGEIGSKIGFSGDALIETLASGDMLRGSLGNGEANIEVIASGTLRPLTFVSGDAASETTATGAFQVKRALEGRITGAATATGALRPMVNLVGNAVAEVTVNGTILSFREVYFEGHAVIETFAIAQQVEYLATFSEDVVAMGLATIIQDFGGNAGRRTIKLNPPDRTLNVGRRSGY